jgi:hypothetical protein
MNNRGPVFNDNTGKKHGMQILNKLIQYHDSKHNSSNVLPNVADAKSEKVRVFSNPESFLSPIKEDKYINLIQVQRKMNNLSTVTCGSYLNPNPKMSGKITAVLPKDSKSNNSSQNTNFKMHSLRTVSVNNYLKNPDISIRSKADDKSKKTKKCFLLRCFGL